MYGYMDPEYNTHFAYTSAVSDQKDAIGKYRK